MLFLGSPPSLPQLSLQRWHEGSQRYTGVLKCQIIHEQSLFLAGEYLEVRNTSCRNCELQFSGGAAATRGCAEEQRKAISCRAAVEYVTSSTSLFYKDNYVNPQR